MFSHCSLVWALQVQTFLKGTYPVHTLPRDKCEGLREKRRTQNPAATSTKANSNGVKFNTANLDVDQKLCIIEEGQNSWERALNARVKIDGCNGNGEAQKCVQKEVAFVRTGDRKEVRPTKRQKVPWFADMVIRVLLV